VDLIALLATLALLGVTAWYAKTTKDMATTAKQAAEASDRATAAAERSADATKEMAETARQAAEDSARATAAAERSAEATKEMADIAKQTAEDSARAAEAAERSAEAARDAATVAQSQVNPSFSGRLVAVSASGATFGHVPCLWIESEGDAVVVQEVRIRRAFRLMSEDGTLGEMELVDEVLSPFSEEHRLPKRLHAGEHVLLTHAAMHDADPEFSRFLLTIDYTFSEAGGAGGTRSLIIDAQGN
jgi:hypothetical protein